MTQANSGHKILSRKRGSCFIKFSTSSQVSETKKRLSLKERYKLKKLKDLKSREKGFIHALPPVFVIVLNGFIKHLNFDVTIACNNIIARHNALIKNHGIISGTKRFNDIRNYAINLLEGKNPDNPGFLATGRKDKWPSFLQELRPLFYRVRDSKCHYSDRVIRSILYLNRLAMGNNAVDVNSVISIKDIDKEFLVDFEKHLVKTIPRFTGELISKPTYRVLRNGPNNKPKWMTAEVEAYALMNSELHDSFKNLCFETGNADLYEYMKVRASKQERVDRVRLRYITSAFDKGNKSRVVAIGDYWTQVLLEPIMSDIQDFCEKKYKGIQHSKDHAGAFRNMKSNIRIGDRSYDMVSWTDNFSAEPQYLWMKSRYGKAIADSWWNLVARCEWSVKGSDQTVIYGTGQGMGIPLSFDLATVTDLEILNYSYQKFYNITISSKVVTKVGDDLHCHDPDGFIHDMYTQKLKMEINLSKTKSATEANLCGEIVSRNINYGREVSRISANICRSVRKNILNLPTLTFHLEERGVLQPLNLPEIFKACRVKNEHVHDYVRTFFVQSYLDVSSTLTPGRKLLRSSLLEHYAEFIHQDDLILALGDNGRDFKPFQNIFFVFMINKLILSINDKIGHVFDSVGEFDSSDLLKAQSEPHLLWSRHDDPIQYLTSVIMLSESFTAFNAMYAATTLTDYRKVLEVLEVTDLNITFKDLGVISEPTKELGRQRTTKLFSLIKSLRINNEALPFIGNLISTPTPSNSGLILKSLVKSNLCIDFDDPLFMDVINKVKILTK